MKFYAFFSFICIFLVSFSLKAEINQSEIIIPVEKTQFSEMDSCSDSGDRNTVQFKFAHTLMSDEKYLAEFYRKNYAELFQEHKNLYGLKFEYGNPFSPPSSHWSPTSPEFVTYTKFDRKNYDFDKTCNEMISKSSSLAKYMIRLLFTSERTTELVRSCDDRNCDRKVYLSMAAFVRRTEPGGIVEDHSVLPFIYLQDYIYESVDKNLCAHLPIPDCRDSGWD